MHDFIMNNLDYIIGFQFFFDVCLTIGFMFHTKCLEIIHDSIALLARK